MAAAASDAHVIAEQIAYYRDRAGEYDQWWFRTGRFDRGPALNAAWFADVAAVESAVFGFLDTHRPATVLELACGTGLQTRHLAPRAGRVTAVDASPEVIAINRARVAQPNVDYVLADLFTWTPPRTYDLVFMSFWLSHVPEGRFDSFWSMVRRAVAPGGFAYVVDSAHDPTSTARDHPWPDADAGVVTRKLDDGRTYRIVKMFHEAGPLNARLATVGFDGAIARTARYFVHGPARPAAAAP